MLRLIKKEEREKRKEKKRKKKKKEKKRGGGGRKEKETVAQLRWFVCLSFRKLPSLSCRHSTPNIDRYRTE